MNLALTTGLHKEKSPLGGSHPTMSNMIDPHEYEHCRREQVFPQELNTMQS